MKDCVDFKMGFGKEKIKFSICSDNIIAELKPKKISIDFTGQEEVIRALNNPIGTQKIGQIVKKGESVCIVTSDITRPCPSHIILPPLLDELIKSGINPEDITIVFGLGSHRRHTEEEMKKIAGEYAYNLVHTMDSDADDVILLGQTSRNTPVNITCVVANADRRICVGNIEMHYFAGYSGGAKAIMPGVSNRESIQANHSMMIAKNNAAGIINENDIRMDIEEAGDICGIDFILNVVLDENKNIVYAVAGDHIRAHRMGCEFLDSMYKIKIPEKADIVIASPGGYPKDINLYQAQKALDNAQFAVKDGGIIILVAQCNEGFGESVFEDWLDEEMTKDEIILKIQRDFKLGGHKAAAIAMVAKKCSEILLVSNMDSNDVKKAFMKPFINIDSALEYALSKTSSSAKYIIMPYAGSTLPSI